MNENEDISCFSRKSTYPFIIEVKTKGKKWLKLQQMMFPKPQAGTLANRKAQTLEVIDNGIHIRGVIMIRSLQNRPECRIEKKNEVTISFVAMTA